MGVKNEKNISRKNNNKVKVTIKVMTWMKS